MAMNRWERRFANFCAVAGVLMLFLAGSLYGIEQQLTQGVTYSFLAGIALLIAYGILDPTAITYLIRSRQARFGSLSIVVTALLLGALVMANVLASRGTQALDLTRGRLNTLAPQSVLAAQRLTADLQMVGLFRAGANNGQREAEALIGLYAAESPHIKYRTENVVTSIQDVRQYGVKIADTIVLDYKGKTELLTPGAQSEQDITSALIKLESDHVPVVCWAVGDGERDLKEINQSYGYSGVADLLSRNNFATHDLLLSQAATIPADCDVVAVVGPSHPLTDVSIKSLSDYLAASGKLLLAAEPWQDAKVTGSVNAIVKPFGLTFTGGLVIEPDASRAAGGDRTTPAIISFGASPISKDLAGTYAFFPQTTAIAGTADPGVSAVPIGETSSLSYGIASVRRDLARMNADKSGPFVIMETIERPAVAKKMRIALAGTGSFAENATLPPNASGANLQLALATFQWLTEQDRLISIAPKASRTLPLTLTQQDQNILIFTTGLFLPALIVVGGLGVWWRRRT